MNAIARLAARYPEIAPVLHSLEEQIADLTARVDLLEAELAHAGQPNGVAVTAITVDLAGGSR